MTWLDYSQVQEDAKTLITTGVTTLNTVLLDADERDINTAQMPLVDIRWVADDPSVRVGQAYYNQGTMEFEVVAYSLESQRAAAIVRNTILRGIADTLRANPHFSISLETVKIGPVAFDGAFDRKAGAFCAVAVLRVYVEAYVD